MTVTYDYYADNYFGEPVSETDFVKYAARAERIVNTIIRGRLYQFDDWHVSVQEAVKSAICAQVEYFALYGLDVAVAGRQGGGFTVGKVSVQDGGDVSKGAKGAATIVAPSVYAYLEQTGLLYPGVPVVGMPPR